MQVHIILAAKANVVQELIMQNLMHSVGLGKTRCIHDGRGVRAGTACARGGITDRRFLVVANGSRQGPDVLLDDLLNMQHRPRQRLMHLLRRGLDQGFSAEQSLEDRAAEDDVLGSPKRMMNGDLTD